MSTVGRIEVPVKVEVASDDEFEQIKKVLEPLLEPYTILVDSDHAEYLEFGSTPASDTSPKYGNGKISPVEEKFRKWVTTKMGLSTGGVKPSKGDRVAKALYKQAMEHGVPPQPFLRPALYEVMNRVANGEDFGVTEAGSLEPLVKEIVSRMDAILTSYGMAHGEDSILDAIEYGPSSTFEEIVPTATDISPELWAKKDGGRPGAPPQGSRRGRL